MRSMRSVRSSRAHWPIHAPRLLSCPWRPCPLLGSLWVSTEARERWSNALQGTPSIAAVSLAAVALKQHCRAFGLLVENAKGAAKYTRDDLELHMHSWCHAGAFGSVSAASAKGKPKAKKGGAAARR